VSKITAIDPATTTNELAAFRKLKAALVFREAL
jgi:hypothetical protein